MTNRRRRMNHAPRTITLWASVAVLMCLASGLPVEAQTLSIDFRGAVPLGATARDQSGEDFTVTGLSGLTWLHGTRFMAIMDNSDKLVFLNVEFTADGAISSARIVGGLTLADSCDFEGIACSTPERDSVFLAEEDTPAVQEYSLWDGALLQTLKPPPVFFNDRANFAFESLSRQPGGTELWTANEEALTVDGDVSTPQHGTVVRLLRYAPADEAGRTRCAGPAEQFAYITEPMHGGDIFRGRSGLVDLAVLPSGQILALERSFALSIPDLFQNRLYELDFSGATEVSKFVDGLDGEVFTPVSKYLLWTGNVGNLEGLALGPPLAGGNRALLGIVDNGDPLSTNQLVAFELRCPE